MIKKIFALNFAALILISCGSKSVDYNPANDILRFKGELHLRNIKQLTFGGNNAEAYWSFDGSKLIFQSDWDSINSQGCDQIFIMNADGSKLNSGEHYKLVSTGKGRTTCSYFLKGDKKIIYASTHEADSACPESPMFVNGKYVWAIYDSYDIYSANEDGTGITKLIGGKGYDAEATVSPDGKYIVFTSTRSGDLDLWRYEIETGNLLQLTNLTGYDGGAFFSHDSKKIVWRASRPVGQAEAQYKELLAQNLVEPVSLNIFTADIDGKNVEQITNLPGANWAPYFHPSDKKILFCSNHHSQKEGGRLFDIFMIDIDTKEIEQITNSGTFDAFPMFSPDGKKLVFASNRQADGKPTRATNIFVADWVDEPAQADKDFKTLIK
ncbi:MAG: PD40 domain-containing protein [Ignavibacteriales bacterium]|nr:PD40 domain-containing protein [Ignavibacteriales bacterium]